MKFPPDSSFEAQENELCIKARGLHNEAKPRCFPGGRDSGNNPEIEDLGDQMIYCKNFSHKCSSSWACWCLTSSSLCLLLFPLDLQLIAAPDGSWYSAAARSVSKAGLWHRCTSTGEIWKERLCDGEVPLVASCCHPERCRSLSKYTRSEVGLSGRALLCVHTRQSCLR